MNILEAKRGIRVSGEIKFQYKNEIIPFSDVSFRKVYEKICKWLSVNGYNFSLKNVFTNYGKLYSIDDVKSSSYSSYFFKEVKSGKYMLMTGNLPQYTKNLKEMLEDFKIDISTLSIDGFDGEKNVEDDKNISQEEPSQDDNFKIQRFGQFGMPTDFKAAQSQDEKETKEYVKNPFRQSICVLGKSGAGKSWTIDDILDKSNHKYEFIIPSASTTGLLSQFSPSAKEGRGGYIPSRLGKMIENAYKNNNTFYTAVFDECHKSNIIEMINDELLQAISTERNKNRFISLDDETSELYPSKVLDERGNISISDNLGFIFISSNARVISGNEDFFNRVDLVELTKESRESVKTIDDLNKLRVKDTDKKYELVSKIMSETKR